MKQLSLVWKAVALSIGLVIGGATAAGADIIRFWWNGSVHTVTDGGDLLLWEPTGREFVNSAASADDRTVYASSADCQYCATSTLMTLDPTIREVTALTPLGNVDIRGLAVSDAGLLYGFDHSTYDLILIDPPTGSLSRVGDTSTALQALAFSPEGELYGWSIGLGLVTVNPDNALTTPIGFGDDMLAQALEFLPDGTLLATGITGDYSVPLPDGGTLELQTFPGGTNARGLAYVVPEPSTGLLMGLGLALFWAARAPSARSLSAKRLQPR